ncbi:hypothetical protein SLA2020_118770 [Shorea laevis]
MASNPDQIFYYTCLITFYLIAPPTWVGCQSRQAAYGKHARPGWGRTIPPGLAWLLMESPTVWLTLLLFPFGRHYSNPKAVLLISPYLFHYVHRTIIYPLRLAWRTDKGTGFPVSVASMAFGFNLLNAYVQARWVSHYKDDYESDEWFWWKFGGGLVIFGLGMWANMWADRVLVGLKKRGGGYRVPRGGLFELVSCANYFGEIVEWLGFAVMSWSWAALAFFVYTCANLIPRARGSHQWYLDKFKEDYPKGRKAVIPFFY